MNGVFPRSLTFFFGLVERFHLGSRGCPLLPFGGAAVPLRGGFACDRFIAGFARFAALSSRVEGLAGEFVSPSSAVPIVRLGPSRNSESMDNKASSSMFCPPGKTEGMNGCVPISSYPR